MISTLALAVTCGAFWWGGQEPGGTKPNATASLPSAPDKGKAGEARKPGKPVGGAAAPAAGPKASEAEQISRLRRAIESSYRDPPRLGVPAILATIERLAADAAAIVAAASHDAVGLSVGFYQTFSSLYFARLLRTMGHNKLIILGGPEVPGEVGASLIDCFPEIDFVVTGEGETPLQRICQVLRDVPPGSWHEAIAAIPASSIIMLTPVHTTPSPVGRLPTSGSWGQLLV